MKNVTCLLFILSLVDVHFICYNLLNDTCKRPPEICIRHRQNITSKAFGSAALSSRVLPRSPLEQVGHFYCNSVNKKTFISFSRIRIVIYLSHWCRDPGSIRVACNCVFLNKVSDSALRDLHWFHGKLYKVLISAL